MTRPTVISSTDPTAESKFDAAWKRSETKLLDQLVKALRERGRIAERLEKGGHDPFFYHGMWCTSHSELREALNACNDEIRGFLSDLNMSEADVASEGSVPEHETIKRWKSSIKPKPKPKP